jgi:hypothetical protein
MTDIASSEMTMSRLNWLCSLRNERAALIRSARTTPPETDSPRNTIIPLKSLKRHWMNLGNQELLDHGQ